jgi:hypothetical protein
MKTVIAVLVASATLLAYDSGSHAKDCTIRSCKSGGLMYQCWAMISKEHAAKSKVCKALHITTGSSSYLMATAFNDVCVNKDAVLWAHRPYFRVKGGYPTAAVGSATHKYFVSRIDRRVLRAFILKGGMKKTGWRNAMFLTPIKASETGLPICKD